MSAPTTSRMAKCFPAKYLAAISFFSVCSTTAANDATQREFSKADIWEWSELYYQDSSKFCTVAKIDKLRLNGDVLEIALLVEQQTRSAITSMDAPDRDAWLALHCPSETNAIWNKTDSDFDIDIVVPETDVAPTQLSCRTYHGTHGMLRSQKKQTVLDKISAMLGRKND